ncbi:MAG TPA: DNA polymerase III subunit gamma/tau [Myxococcota bacterium]|nr:DNA polymerase III subunit gamma/tau [Myxococcota bacterium]
MSYEVLARRFRPQTFDDVEGQRHVVTALRNALRLGRVPHAILLAGPRGVAKTTLARILARALNCDEGPTEKPCGRCPPCLEIAAGTSLDVQEIDAASNTGVDNVREIRESVRYAAAPGKHRIFIIDEVHMLSTAAFNALLKTLEEPPPHSLFIFATTDPQKIPSTVLSRVQRFDLRRLSNAELLALLRKICSADGIEAPEPVLRAIAREADGSGRDALTLLDRLTSALGQKLGLTEAIAILDLIDRKLLLDVLAPVLGRDPATAFVALRRALEQGVDPMRFASDLLAEIRDLIVARLVDDPTGLIDAAPDALAETRARAAAHDPETLQRMFRVLLTRMQELGAAARQEHALEMAIVRLATLPDGESLAVLVQKLDALDGGGSGPTPGAPAPAAAPGGATGSRPPPRSGASAAPFATARSAAPSGPPPPRSAAPAVSAPAPVAPAAAASTAVEPAGEEPPPPDDAELLSLANADEPAAPARVSALSHEQRAALEARARSEAKAHPRVQQVIEALDAELREIRVERGSAAKRGEVA